MVMCGDQIGDAGVRSAVLGSMVVLVDVMERLWGWTSQGGSGRVEEYEGR